MSSQKVDSISRALHACLISPNEADRNDEPANVVDALFFIGRALFAVAEELKVLTVNATVTTWPKDD